MAPDEGTLPNSPAAAVAVPNGALPVALSVTSSTPGAAVAKALLATAVVAGVPAVVPGVIAVVPAGLGGAATTAVDGVDETTVSADGFFAIGTCTTVWGCTSGACSSV